jgi:hypothetical protein
VLLTLFPPTDHRNISGSGFYRQFQSFTMPKGSVKGKKIVKQSSKTAASTSRPIRRRTTGPGQTAKELAEVEELQLSPSRSPSPVQSSESSPVSNHSATSYRTPSQPCNDDEFSDRDDQPEDEQVASDDYKESAQIDAEHNSNNRSAEVYSHEQVGSDDYKRSAKSSPVAGSPSGSPSGSPDCVCIGEEPAESSAKRDAPPAAQDVTIFHSVSESKVAPVAGVGPALSPLSSPSSKAKGPFTSNPQLALGSSANSQSGEERSGQLGNAGEDRLQGGELRSKQHERKKDKELAKQAKREGARQQHGAAKAAKRNAADVDATTESLAVKALIEQLNKQAQQIADLGSKLYDERQDLARMREDVEAVLDEKHRLEATIREQQERLDAPKPAPNPLDNIEYRQRFEWLVQRGWTVDEAGTALEATKQGGVYSSNRADAHLKAISDRERLNAVAKANEHAANANDETLIIADDSALARVLAKNVDAVDIIVKLKTTHAQTKARGAHTAQTAVGACNLVQMPSIQNDQRLARKGFPFLGQVALAVCEDCFRCKEQRDKMDADLRERERVKAAKEEAEAKRRKIQEEKAEEQRKRALNKPLSLNFRATDSKQDVKLPRLLCANPTCGKGWEAGKWLYHCHTCKQAYHETHTEFTLVRETSGEEYFTCQVCTEKREKTGPTWSSNTSLQVIGSDIANRKAPRHQEAADDRSQIDERTLPAQATTTESIVGSAQQPAISHVAYVASTPPPGDRGDSNSRLQATPLHTVGTVPTYATQKELDFSSVNTAGEKALKSPTVQMKEYLVWEAIPKDWKPTIRNGIPQEHPTHGWGKSAYQNWRRRNISLRDTHVAGSAARGPFSRAIAPELKTLVGTHLLLSPEKVARFWTESQAWPGGPDYSRSHRCTYSSLS